MLHDFDDPKCSLNAIYQKQLCGWIRRPRRHYRGQLVIGEYYNVSRYKSLPLCLMHSMAHDIPLYYKSGACAFQYMHVTTGRWGNKSLTNYQMARQLWDVKPTAGALEGYLPAALRSGRPGRCGVSTSRWSDALERRVAEGLAFQLPRGWKTGEGLFLEPHLRYRREPGDGVRCAHTGRNGCAGKSADV